jgi:hypothetical protein
MLLFGDCRAQRARRRVSAGVVLVCLGLLAACTVERSQDAAQAQKTMIGFDKSHVQDCMGPPLATRATGDTEVWTYSSATAPAPDRSQSASLTPRLFCQADIAMTKGAVTGIVYSGATGGMFTRDEQCGQLVARCLPPRPPGTASRLLDTLKF